MGDWQTVAGHRIRATEDSVEVVPNGHMDVTHIRWLFDDILLPIIAKHGLAFVLLDARQGTPADAESRRLISSWVREHPGQTVFAVFGASRTASAVGTLLLNAIRLVSGRQLQLKMFDERSDAEAWLQERREHHRKGLPFAR